MKYGRNVLLKVSFSMIINTIKNFFEINPCPKPFSDPLVSFIKVRILAGKYKFNNKDNLICAWRYFNKTLWGIYIYAN